jgi:hypothetical protein
VRRVRTKSAARVVRILAAYSERAQRIRTVYPYVRYGLILAAWAELLLACYV